MPDIDTLVRFWPHLAAAFGILAASLASAHVLLNKRDPAAAAQWIVVIWLAPVLGALLYLTLGVNRIRRRAIALAVHGRFSRPLPENLGEPHLEEVAHLVQLARAVGLVVAKPLMAGNNVQPLINGDEAFPEMLAAIDTARESVALSTYIFDNDVTGGQFVAALGRAVTRGVAVRVLVDAAGLRYSFPPVTGTLRHARVPHARFLPTSLFTPWRVVTINLRNHRKSLIVDGRVAFVGGMNIRHGNVLADQPKHPVQDLHFRVEGPVVGQLQEAFANDWTFTTREVLDGPAWFPEPADAGKVVARAITHGPDTDFEKLRWTLLTALSEAQSSVQIVTPYFLPDNALSTALDVAALRGVRVDIVMPARNNLPFVHWASRAMWSQVLERGCRLWLTPPPFDHSKLMVVDGHWVLFGSANWDARSLFLNFEINVECYGREIAASVAAVIDRKLRGAHEVTLAEVNARPLPAKLRDAAARVFSPYL